MTPRRALGGLALGAALLASGLAWRGVVDFDLSKHRTRDLSFEAGGAHLAGTLVLPETCDDGPVAVLVHGDGPQDRWSGQGYLPLVSALLEACIGVYSWDKPGVGDSTGDWLGQSMADRAVEAGTALQAVRAALGPERRIGFLGLSQAGWIVPRASAVVGPEFVVLTGVAVDWAAQGAYFDSRSDGRQGPPASPERAAFNTRNGAANAEADLPGLQGRVLALWGAEDLNVDPIANAATYEALAPRGTVAEVIPGATHSLLRSRWFQGQLQTDWPWWKVTLFTAMGRRAYAPDVLERITGWINGPGLSGARR
ncbi:hypothetical protein JANAI62_07460 [Jannaschia pagri]|uniref:Alpha/beta hydrolase n=1 Tax=Jannaschia pagri TaxID=2829797 RepID=A0ABQ4NI71_9RHOB|nr:MULTISPECIES: alpha/beta hydrolase [unclassified Jannaschia]GIT89769.1 hypothetical protein JANAI61_02270 [Jannaschia sp. AI_61]GIT94123.1 hypothetical protein JANAI62_07460 [Jannaschia sp. AI_62]